MTIVKNTTFLFVTFFLCVPLSGNLGEQLGAHFRAILAGNPVHREEGDISDFKEKYPSAVLDARFESLYNFCIFFENRKNKTGDNLNSIAYEFASQCPICACQLLEDRLGYAESAAWLAVLELGK